MIHTCDYCTARMYREALTPEARLAFRLGRFIEELRKNSTGLYRRDSVADVLEHIIECELGDEELEKDTGEELRSLRDVELMRGQLERDAR